VQLKTAVTSGKKRTSLQDPQEDPRAEIHEESTRDVQRIAANPELESMEGLAPSEAEKEAVALA
jgi:hypothetical protein